MISVARNFHSGRLLAKASIVLDKDEIVQAGLELASKGFYVESTCARAAARCHQQIRGGQIRNDEYTVGALTGTGLKATASHADQFL